VSAVTTVRQVAACAVTAACVRCILSAEPAICVLSTGVDARPRRHTDASVLSSMPSAAGSFHELSDPAHALMGGYPSNRRGSAVAEGDVEAPRRLAAVPMTMSAHRAAASTQSPVLGVDAASPPLSPLPSHAMSMAMPMPPDHSVPHSLSVVTGQRESPGPSRSLAMPLSPPHIAGMSSAVLGVRHNAEFDAAHAAPMRARSLAARLASAPTAVVSPLALPPPAQVPHTPRPAHHLDSDVRAVCWRAPSRVYHSELSRTTCSRASTPCCSSLW
jgi:hypothetical protein